MVNSVSDYCRIDLKYHYYKECNNLLSNIAFSFSIAVYYKVLIAFEHFIYVAIENV